MRRRAWHSAVMSSFHVFAPAKINLLLHVTGKRYDGYHLLQSLVAFADVGDDLKFLPQGAFEVEMTGPFAAALPEAADNLIYKAAQLLSEEYKVPMHGQVVLTKNLPIASGIGGGSADAAAALTGLRKLWNLPDEPARLQKIALVLGADVPACVYGRTLWMEGVGEKLTPVTDLPALHLVLVNPLVATSTPAVFKNFREVFSPSLEKKPLNVEYLGQCRNDLTRAAIAVTPEIGEVLAAISVTERCLFYRLSGSGATCFGVYADGAAAKTAAAALKAQHPAWWITAAITL
jgi:4-diphosphocytidyl-2-C-methyl-D-erythritol kinase